MSGGWEGGLLIWNWFEIDFILIIIIVIICIIICIVICIIICIIIFITIFIIIFIITFLGKLPVAFMAGSHSKCPAIQWDSVVT